MRIPTLPRVFAPVAVAVVLLATAGSALAIGERIVDIRVTGASRTDESTVRSIAGIKIGYTLENDTLGAVRDRLNTTGLFADVNVWWEPFGEGVRVNISVKDKFPWAPVPTASWSSTNRSIGLLFVHGNLFGWGKQLVLGGRLAQLDSGAVLAYRDPALFQTWMYWEVKGIYQRTIAPEYVNDPDAPYSVLNPVSPWRKTTFSSLAVEPVFGVAWLRRVKTQVSWRLEKVDYKSAEYLDPATGASLGTDDDTKIDPLTGYPVPPAGPHTMKGGIVGVGRASVAFDWRSRLHAVMSGQALGGNIDIGGSEFGGDFSFWRASVFWEQGIKILRRHNFIYSGFALTGRNLPLSWDAASGGPNLRGYLFQQFRGDTQIAAKAEYHFPLFSVGSADFRGLAFYDVGMVWFREVPEGCDLSIVGTTCMRLDGDLRTFRYVTKGFDRDRNVHTSAGGGIRFFLRSVAVPLVGVDIGYGIESHHLQYLIVVGA